MKKPLLSLILTGLAIASGTGVYAQLIISGISAGSITERSVVITWSTSIPANSQVNYGTTSAYGLSTLLDPTYVSSHSMVLNSLAPGTLYHFQITSRNPNGTATSSDITFSAAALASSSGSLDTHSIKSYPSGKIVPWMLNPSFGYDSVIKLAWNYLLNSVPNDPSTGKPAYYSQSFLYPNTGAMGNWPHNPAGMYAMLVESALKYYAYSGNANVMQLAINVATWHLDHGMTALNDSWPGVPYSEGQAGSTNYSGAASDGVGFLEPDKIGELGYAWLQLYKYNGNIPFRDAAIKAGDVLSSKVRTGSNNQSPWPFRVNAHDGGIEDDYCANVIGPVSLLDGLIAAGLGNTAAYQAARDKAWNWMMTYPMQNNVWTQYFEDVGPQSNYNTNLNQYNANMAARYLLEHPGFDQNWEAHVRGIITWVENIFGVSQNGATIIKEQTPAFPYTMGSHTSRYASVNALLFEKTGDLAAKEKAYRSFNWATYMARTTGVVIDGPLYGDYANANQWFSDGYGDYIRHFMTGLAAVPEWVPFNQTHLLRSSSVVKSVSYGLNSIDYTTYDGNSTEVLHVNFNPVTVTANGVALSQRSDLSQPGWTLDINTKTLKIYHSSGTQISVNSSGNAVLPVGLGEFTATINNNNSVDLDWNTYSEINSKEFDIERSVDGTNFETIHVTASAGNSNSTRHYNYQDNNLPQRSILYYRLKLVDMDGQYIYSKVLQLRFKQGSFYVNNIYPEPASSIVHIDVYNASVTTNCTLSFITINGATVKRSTMILNKGDNIIDIDISSLAKGVYLLKLNNKETQVVERLIKE